MTSLQPRLLQRPAGVARPPKARLPIASLFEAQNEIIDLMARGTGLGETLTQIAGFVERFAPPALCSILLAQPDGKQLRHGAGPSLPDLYNRAVDGIPIGPGVGSCGTAAFTRQPVIVTDIAVDPLWEGPPRELAMACGLHACWSMPNLDESGDVLGTIAMYYREPRAPTGRDFGLLAPAARLVRLALAQNRKEEALRESERRFRDFAQMASDLLWELGPDLRFTYMSERVAELVGSPASSYIGQPVADVLRRELDPADARTLLDLLEARSAFRDVSARAIRREGVVRYLRISGQPIHDGPGRFLGFRGGASDETERAETAARLQAANEQLVRDKRSLSLAKRAAEDADRAKSVFVSNMSHELRTPLNAVIGFSDMMLNGVFGSIENSRYLGYVENIHASGTHLLQIINEILDFSKVEAGKVELHDELLDLGPLVDHCLALVRERPEARCLKLGYSPGTDARLVADARRVKQMLLNLLSNAVKFTPAGGEVVVETRLDAGGALAVAVRDTGIGIAEKDLARVLEPFSQVETTYSRSREGTGLGLPLVKTMAELHGATFDLESHTGHGTRATILFPPRRVRLTAAVG